MKTGCEEDKYSLINRSCAIECNCIELSQPVFIYIYITIEQTKATQ